MAKKKTKRHAAPIAATDPCPMCGLVPIDPDPGVYVCTACGSEGYDCCVPGNGCLCMACEEEAEGVLKDEH